MDAGVIAFRHIEGADHAFASAEERTPGASWLQKAAFVEVHRNGRIVVRGTIAGHYVDIDDEGDLIGGDTARGAAIGVLAGLALGPPGWAEGLVGGGLAGGLEQASHIPRLKGPGFDEIRKDVPESSSAVAVDAASADGAPMDTAFPPTPGPLTRDHL